ncbi:TPA: ZIP family metal transporter [archaeon]|uniref:ZIP family metal transporter n=1 Tax=Candidatus Naiadarchaeum limnaeum TaxID=2756139 RepID=A0A832UV35_9ARCH|nr:ZIP family metal transporter [Candidatus Naiadarchaeales archaeon SRR2090153.bin1042]HIK00250.1 ZIP family metal transporter [Candidatus Naiadarchaeum limnaeum]
MTLGLILLSVLIVSLVSLVGILTISMSGRKLKNIIFILISFAAGTMLGGAFFDLLPEAAEIEGILIADIFLYTLIGVIVFFLIESFIHLYHCHVGYHKPHEYRHKPIAYLSLIADGLHNFLDGIAIAISFLVGIEVGVAVTIAVILHEIPQEINDFSILIYGGFSNLKALGFNFLSALTAFIGALFAYFFSASMGGGLTAFLLAFSGGGFIYMSAANLIPEMHREAHFDKSVLQLIVLLLGIAIIFVITNFA